MDAKIGKSYPFFLYYNNLGGNPRLGILSYICNR